VPTHDRRSTQIFATGSCLAFARFVAWKESHFFRLSSLHCLFFVQLAVETPALCGAKTLEMRRYLAVQEGQHPLTGQRAANFRLLANQ